MTALLDGAPRTLVLNSPGIGNVLIALPFLAALERDRGIGHWFHVDSPALNDPFFASAAGVERLAGVVPAVWRRCGADALAAMRDFCRARRIELVINLRIDEPALEGAWFAARRALTADGVRCVDLYDDGDRLVGRRAIASRIDAALRRARLLSGPVRHDWLAHVRRPAAAKFVAAYVGVSQPIKRWPVERWATLLTAVAERTSLPVHLLTGVTDDERQFADDVLAALGSLDVRARDGLDFRAICDELGAAELVLTHDTFVLHAAAALAVPVVGLFVATDGAIWQPAAAAGTLGCAQAAALPRCSERKANGTCRRYYDGANRCHCAATLSVSDVLATVASLSREPLRRRA